MCGLAFASAYSLLISLCSRRFDSLVSMRPTLELVMLFLSTSGLNEQQISVAAQNQTKKKTKVMYTCFPFPNVDNTQQNKKQAKVLLFFVCRVTQIRTFFNFFWLSSALLIYTCFLSGSDNRLNKKSNLCCPQY